MAYDARIILAGQSPDVVGSLARGTQAAGMSNDVMQQNRLSQVFQQDGPGIMAGDGPSLNRLAQIDPMAGLGVQQTRLGMDATRQGMQHSEDRLRLAYQQAGMQAQQFASQLDERQRAQARQTFEQGANMLAAAQTPEQFAQIAQMPGVAEMVDQFVGPGMLNFENRGVIASAAMGAAEAMKVTGQQGPEPTAGMREYEMARAEGFQGSFMEYQAAIAEARRSQTSVTVNNADPNGAFYGELDKRQANMFDALMTEGVQAQRKTAQLDQLEGLLSNVSTGAGASFQAMLGNFGIPTEGLDEIQAAQAIINQIVPAQREPGSGPMSDRDLELFRQSVPRIINQPGGNQRILRVMRGVLEYTASQAEIATLVANRELSPSAGRQALAALPNPLAAFSAGQGGTGAPAAAPAASAPAAGQPSPGEAPAFIPADDRARWQYFDDETRQLMIQHYGGQR